MRFHKLSKVRAGREVMLTSTVFGYAPTLGSSVVNGYCDNGYVGHGR
jgi:hypothetical protein